MKIVGCDLHAKQPTIAMVDTDTGELIERTLPHEGNAARVLRCLGGPGSCGHRSDRIHAVVFRTTGRVGDRVSSRPSGEDPPRNKVLIDEGRSSCGRVDSTPSD